MTQASRDAAVSGSDGRGASGGPGGARDSGSADREVAGRVPSGRDLPDAPTILVIETGLVGELLVTTPTLRAVARAYPRASVTVIVSPGSAPVLVGNPAVSRLLPLRKEERRGMGLFRVASWIRSQRFDAVLVLHTSFRSALLAAVARVPVRAGLSCEGRAWLLNRRTPRDRSAYEVDEHLRVAGLLGVEPAGRELELFLTEEERAEAARLLDRALAGTTDGHERALRDDGSSSKDGAASHRPLVGLHPGASREIRRWPAERFAELGERILDSGQARPFYVFGPREQDLARAVRSWYERNGRPAPVIIEPSSIRMLGALFAHATAVVTNNTGPMHVAAAVRVPGVFIHGPTPVNRWHPPGPGNEAVSSDVDCRPCDSPKCRMESLLCMEAVTVDQVLDALTRVLARAEQHHTREASSPLPTPDAEAAVAPPGVSKEGLTDA